MPITRSATKRKIKEEMDRKGYDFNLLGCPDEVIDRFFSYLDPDDRLRMRLNRRLNKIVAESKYYLERVVLEQIAANENKCVTIKKRQYPFDFINRIAHNATIRELEIFYLDSDELTNKFIDLIKEFRNVGQLEFQEVTKENLNEIMTDSFFLDLTRKCKTLRLECSAGIKFNNISAEALHQVYKNMNDSSTSSSNIYINYPKNETVESFLTLLDISFRNEHIFSNRKIEAYKDSGFMGSFFVNIFDGFFHIQFRYCAISRKYSHIDIKLYKNLEDLNRSKNKNPDKGSVRTYIDVLSE